VNNWTEKVKEGQKDVVSYETSVKSNQAIIMFDLLNPEVGSCGQAFFL